MNKEELKKERIKESARRTYLKKINGKVQRWSKNNKNDDDYIKFFLKHNMIEKEESENEEDKISLNSILDSISDSISDNEEINNNNIIKDIKQPKNENELFPSII